MPREKMTLAALANKVRELSDAYGSAGVRVEHSDREVWATVFVGDPAVEGDLLDIFEADIIEDVCRKLLERAR